MIHDGARDLTFPVQTSEGLHPGKWQFAKEKAVLSFQCYDIFEKTYANMRVNYAKQVQDFDSQKYKRIFALTFTYKFNDYKRGGRGVDTSRFGTR